MSAPPIRVDRIRGAGPLCEIGKPLAAELSPDGTLLVVGGHLGWLQWHGHDVSRGVGRPYRLAVYDGLECRYLLPTRWPAKAIAFHPALPVVAIGTGEYDGGYFYEGELLFLNLVTGSAVSLLEWPREVRKIAWRDERTLDLVLAVPTDEDEERLGTTSVACSIQRDDWDRATSKMLKYPREEVPVPEEAPSDPDAATALVRRHCSQHGVTWRLRRAVWAVRALADGRVLGALEDVAMECWLPDSAEVAWRLPTEGKGCQLHLSPDEKTALTLTQKSPKWSQAARTWTTEPSVLTRAALDDGDAPETWGIGAEAVLAVRADGWWALRDAEGVRDPAQGSVTLWSPRGIRSAVVQLGRYDLFNHYFDIRYAPDFLFLQGNADRPWEDKWVVAVDPPAGAIRRLFPLEWDETRGHHLFGGPGAYLNGDHGPALVHAGAVHDGRGLLPGNSFVACRAYPSGEPRWIFTADAVATCVDADGDYIYVAFNSGDLVVLHAADGAVRARHEVRVDGHKVIPLSLAVAGLGRIAIGTLDGRILACSVLGY